MKKSMISLCFTVAVGAFAGTITETTDDMTAQGDWEVTVAAGDTNVVTVAQSGTGKIIAGKGCGHDPELGQCGQSQRQQTDRKRDDQLFQRYQPPVF